MDSHHQSDARKAPWFLGGLRFALLSSCVAVHLSGQVPSSQGTVLKFDRKWWLQASSSEQQGFVYGYLDCRQYASPAKTSVNVYQQAVSKLLNGDRRPDSVPAAIDHASITLPSRSLSGGESYSGPHGFLDGEMWGNFSGSFPPDVTAQDRGYTEGYLACALSAVHSVAVTHYQTLVTKYYASGRHDHDAIADVMKSIRAKEHH